MTPRLLRPARYWLERLTHRPHLWHHAGAGKLIRHPHAWCCRCGTVVAHDLDKLDHGADDWLYALHVWVREATLDELGWLMRRALA